MRAVSRATWTSAEPVSPSARPYLPISSCFFSAVRPIKTPRPSGLRRREISTEPSGLFDVSAHLGHELVNPVEALLAPETSDEGDPQGAAVEIGAVVDEIRLDQDAAP